MPFGIAHQILARIHVPFPPGSNDVDVWIKGVIANLEAHLIIALASRTMGNRIRTNLMGDLDLALRNQGARD